MMEQPNLGGILESTLAFDRRKERAIQVQVLNRLLRLWCALFPKTSNLWLRGFVMELAAREFDLPHDNKWFLDDP